MPIRIRTLFATIGAVAMAAALLAAGLVPIASAAAPARLTTQITDQAGVLGARTGEIQAALDTLLQKHDVQLFVDVVDTTGSLTATQFADRAAEASSLGGNDLLLVVAIEDRSDAIWISDPLATRLTDPELNGVLTDTLEPGLRVGDYPGGDGRGAGERGRGGRRRRRWRRERRRWRAGDATQHRHERHRHRAVDGVRRDPARARRRRRGAVAPAAPGSPIVDRGA
jgi:hypothetical protein